MSPFFEKPWWAGFKDQWSVGSSVPPAGGWSAHNGGRNQLYLDLPASWVRKNIDQGHSRTWGLSAIVRRAF